jgi:hypothetical protein
MLVYNVQVGFSFVGVAKISTSSSFPMYFNKSLLFFKYHV